MDAETRAPYQAARLLRPTSVVSMEPLSHGHINATWRVNASDDRHYVLQCVNGNVFQDVAALSGCLLRTCARLRAWRFPLRYPEFRLVDGQPHLPDEEGRYWRLYPWIPAGPTLARIEAPATVRQAGRAFGLFLAAMDHSDPHSWALTIPGFHDLYLRFAQLTEARRGAPADRLAKANRTLHLVATQQPWAARTQDLILATEARIRIVHQDAKLENLLFGPGGVEVVGLIDLDTVMPGLALYDFGDLVRSVLHRGMEHSASTAFEPQLFEALADGYIGAAKAALTPREAASLALGPRYMTLSLGVRFLTDYLSGDRYFPATSPEQNLHRADAQLGRIGLLQARESWMQDTLARLYENTAPQSTA